MVFLCVKSLRADSPQHEQLPCGLDRSPNMSYMMPPPGIWLCDFTSRGSIVFRIATVTSCS